LNDFYFDTENKIFTTLDEIDKSNYSSNKVRLVRCEIPEFFYYAPKKCDVKSKFDNK
jgi:hypothetical protein